MKTTRIAVWSLAASGGFALVALACSTREPARPSPPSPASLTSPSRPPPPPPGWPSLPAAGACPPAPPDPFATIGGMTGSPPRAVPLLGSKGSIPRGAGQPAGGAHGDGPPGAVATATIGPLLI